MCKRRQTKYNGFLEATLHIHLAPEIQSGYVSKLSQTEVIEQHISLEDFLRKFRVKFKILYKEDLNIKTA